MSKSTVKLIESLRADLIESVGVTKATDYASVIKANIYIKENTVAPENCTFTYTSLRDVEIVYATGRYKRPEATKYWKELKELLESNEIKSISWSIKN